MYTKYLSRTWAEINLDAIAHNLRRIIHITQNKAKVLCVVKADAYGHGFYEIAKTLQENGAFGFAVATFEEAKLLREHGFCEYILVLGRVDEAFASDMLSYDIATTTFDRSFAETMSKLAVSSGKTARLHIKLDTGMSRIGFGCTEEDAKTIRDICNLPGIEAEGIFSHFACADEADHSMTDRQFSAFSGMLDMLKDMGITFRFPHICNSAGITEFPAYHQAMVRPGIILYGCYPSEEVDKSHIDLIPAMTVKARITHVKTVQKGTSVSYGATYTAEKDRKIATVSIGYADGYFRTLSGKAYMTVHGVRVPVVGRICMDQCMIDVSDVHTIHVGDEVTVFGNGSDGSITAAELASLAGTISYELLCAVGNRTPRIYIRNGEIVDVLTYLR